ncbi:pyridoxal phosphate-dependent aminotransferase [Usitatibacter palustris]|uniref:Aspartate aminotransferase n=1 Tax=Usitatibacter palustris TaxID=2732487 RepID=A0A6M4H9D4_9PROT|nr:pyridoxal phosphate-dependent aminotransferase [Usitatibacter palustris]QJR16181.1 Aspartate aminotransferase [Usitatibacter palustris]
MNDAPTFHLAARMAHIAPFEVMEIQKLARKLEAEGRDIIHLEIGEPDFRTPQPVVDAAKRALDEQPMRYTSAMGLQALRKAIAQFYADRYGVEISYRRIAVTAGSSAALLLAFGVVLDAGDEVLLADPSYPCNRHFMRTLGGVPKLIPVGTDTQYQLTADLVSRNWGERTRMAMVASPSNPTGTLVAPEEVARMTAAVREKSGTLLMDEIYHGLTYGVDARTALECGDDIFVINSFSKYFHMTGWRLGWLVVPEAYERQVETLAQNLYISPSAPAQHAALACFLRETIAILEQRRAELAQRRDYLIPALESLGFRIPVVPQGAFYLYADCSALTGDSFAFARDVLERAGVAITPGKDFGNNAPERHIRIAYTQPIARLKEAVARIAAITTRNP